MRTFLYRWLNRAKRAGLVHRGSAFRRNTVGVAAVEFAIVLPVALLFYVGAAEVSESVMASRRVSTVTKTLVDLTSLQGTTTQALSTPPPANATSASTLSTLLSAAATLLSPQPTTTLTMTISAIDITNNAQGKCCSALVRWSYTQNGTLRPCATQITALAPSSDYNVSQIPGGLLPTGTTLASPIAVLVSDVAYTYQPVAGQKILNISPSMQRTEYMYPRATGQVATEALPLTGTQHGVVCY